MTEAYELLRQRAERDRAEAAHYRKAIKAIGTECQNYTPPATCLSSGRIIGAEYGEDAACDQCVVRYALQSGSPELKPSDSLYRAAPLPWKGEGFAPIVQRGDWRGGLIMSADGETVVAQCVSEPNMELICRAVNAYDPALKPPPDSNLSAPISSGDFDREPPCPKHTTGGGPCYCDTTRATTGERIEPSGLTASERQSYLNSRDPADRPEPSEALDALERVLTLLDQYAGDGVAMDVADDVALVRQAISQPVPADAIEELCGELERRGIDTSEWDGEDGPIEAVANGVAKAIGDAAVPAVFQRLTKLVAELCHRIDADAEDVGHDARPVSVLLREIGPTVSEAERALADSAQPVPAVPDEWRVPWIIVNRPGLVPERKRTATASADDIHSMLTALYEIYPDATCTLLWMQPHGPEPQSGKEWLDMYAAAATEGEQS